MQKNNLSWQREQIDSIDQQILKLIADRKQVAKEIAKAKMATGSNVLDKKREEEVIHNRQNLGDKFGLCKDFVNSLMCLVMGYSRKTQSEFMAMLKQDEEKQNKS